MPETFGQRMMSTPPEATIGAFEKGLFLRFGASVEGFGGWASLAHPKGATAL
jgi:hypothetical protein